MPRTIVVTNPSCMFFSDLNSEQISRVGKLEISSDQEEFGGSFDASISELRQGNEESKEGLVFRVDDQFIGLAILKRRPVAPDWVLPDDVSLHGFKIDTKWQGKGLGKGCFGLIPEAVLNRWPDCRNLVLSVDAENLSALSVYRGFGMEDSGPIYQGRIGMEHRLSLDLRQF